MPTQVNMCQYESDAVYLGKYDNSLTGLHLTLSHMLELGSKKHQEQTGEISRRN